MDMDFSDKRAVDGVFRPAASKMPEYSNWSNMRQRCRNKNNPAWSHYGGRGIEVCKRWDSFWLFLKDVGRKPSPESSLDRIDVNGDYEPDNVRWASRRQQSRNRRDNNTISYDGRTLCVQEWSKLTGIASSTIRGRIGKGWTAKKTLTSPVRSTERVLSFRGVDKTLSEWADVLGITSAALCARLKRWSLERSLTELPNKIKASAGRLSRG